MTPKQIQKKYARVRKATTSQQYEYLTERHYIRESNEYYKYLDKLTHTAKNIVNAATYQCRQAIFKGTWMNYYDLNRYFKNARDTGQANIYSQLGHVQTTQQMLKRVASSFTAWKRARKAYLKDPSKFTGRPKLPKFLQKNGHATLELTGQRIRIDNGKIVIPYFNNMAFHLEHKNTDKIQQVRIVPSNRKFIVEIVYKTNLEVQYKEDNGRYLGIDPGLNNAFTLASNVPELQPVAINGKPIKSLNHFFNKRRTKLQSINAISHSQVKYSKQMYLLSYYRAVKLERYAHESSKWIVDYALRHDINTIVIGNNKGYKSGIHLGKRTNQNFLGIPHQKFVDKIKYKANRAGIAVIMTNESYTSQTSFLDSEDPIKQNGNDSRKERGLAPFTRRVLSLIHI